MAERFNPGDRVTSFVFGPGVVKSATANGAFATVFFDAINGLERVHASELQRVGVAAVAATAGTAAGVPMAVPPPRPLKMVPAPPPAASPPVAAAPTPRDTRRLAVECLRQGLPPPGGLATWTVGAQKARDQVNAAIRRASAGEGTTLLVRAGYGKGKSHLGRLARELALEARFATLHIELDGDAVTLRTGAKWLSLLFASLLLPKTSKDEEARVAGLGQLLHRVAKNAPAATRDLEVFEPFLGLAQGWMDSEDAILVLERYLSGDLNAADSGRRLGEVLRTSIRLPSIGVASKTMEDRRQAQCEQLARVVRLAKLCGAAGGLVVIDELDHDLQWQDGRSAALLRHLIEVAAESPIVALLLAKDDSDLDVPGVENLEIDSLQKDEIAELVDRTCQTFVAAYPLPALQRGRSELLKALERRYKKEYDPRGWGPRFFVRATIEACEVVRSRGLPSLADVRI